ncbi:MAG: hypothetical protein ACYTJ0_04830 [Planctomycetota bacterium]|jgi:hypothetical protein
MYVPTNPGPSPLARELGEQIALFVREYRQDNAELTDLDVEHALRLARGQLRGGAGSTRTVALIAGGLALTAGLGLFLIISRGSGGAAPPYIVLAVIVAVFIAMLGVAAVRR